ncbi:MAG TPA: hypothetical protein VL401_03905 [Alphaproteobacteria bacterium]|jgi:hypothetical protein|nr:hypothetical protein [Alphaproteobacteria bacterium]
MNTAGLKLVSKILVIGSLLIVACSTLITPIREKLVNSIAHYFQAGNTHAIVWESPTQLPQNMPEWGGLVLAKGDLMWQCHDGEYIYTWYDLKGGPLWMWDDPQAGCPKENDWESLKRAIIEFFENNRVEYDDWWFWAKDITRMFPK